jgi:hypothetical protein
MFGDAEDLEAAKQLRLADLTHGRRRPTFFIHRATFSACGGDADHAPTVADRLRHEARSQVRLVIRMCPDAEDRAEVLHCCNLLTG